LVRQPKTAVLGWNQSTNISYPGSQSVNAPKNICKFNNFFFMWGTCVCT